MVTLDLGVMGGAMPMLPIPSPAMGMYTPGSAAFLSSALGTGGICGTAASTASSATAAELSIRLCMYLSIYTKLVLVDVDRCNVLCFFVVVTFVTLRTI